MLKEMRAGKKVIAMVAPSVLAQFGKPIEQVYGSLKAMGFHDIVEVAYGAEETIRREAEELKEKMEDYFDWIGSVRDEVPPKSETGKGITYSLNQKEYLMGVLTNPDVPLDNSEAERKIRSFVVSRKNFVLVDTIAGAQASAVMFSMSETLRANGLKAYEYFRYVLEEMPKYMGKNFKDHTFVDDFLPWSDKLPAELRKKVK